MDSISLDPIPPDDPFLLRVSESLRGRKVGLRVLVVATREIAGQGKAIAKALNDHTIHAARFVLYEDDYLAYPGNDVVLGRPEVPGGVPILDPETLTEAIDLADRADLFHFIRLPPMDDDFRWAERIGRGNALVQYYGSEIRSDPKAHVRWHTRTGVLGVSGWDWTLIERAPMTYHVPLIYDPPEGEQSAAMAEPTPKVLRIAHPTTRRAFKGTEALLSAVEAVRAQGVGVEAVLIEGVSNEECLRVKRTCHATFDQLSVGCYGLSAIESMAMGHPVLGGLSSWSRSVYPDIPTVPATAETLVDDIKRLVLNPCRRDLGLRGRAWVQAHHSPRSVIRRTVDLYRHVREGNVLIPWERRDLL